MVTGLFNKAGFFSGDQLLSPTVSNPDGYFESTDINQINNELIAELLRWPRLENGVRRKFAPTHHLDRRAFAFASPIRIKSLSIAKTIREQIRGIVSHQPFCLKDPRFCLTLSFWTRELESDPRIIVVFRHPSKTIESYKRNGERVYDPPLRLDERSLAIAYARNYARLLRWSQPDWLFVHYDQVLSGDATQRLEQIADRSLCRSHLNPNLRRSSGTETKRLPGAAIRVYNRLCRAAGLTARQNELVTGRTYEARV